MTSTHIVTNHVVHLFSQPLYVPTIWEWNEKEVNGRKAKAKLNQLDTDTTGQPRCKSKTYCEINFLYCTVRRAASGATLRQYTSSPHRHVWQFCLCQVCQWHQRKCSRLQSVVWSQCRRYDHLQKIIRKGLFVKASQTILQLHGIYTCSAHGYVSIVTRELKSLMTFQWLFKLFTITNTTCITFTTDIRIWSLQAFSIWTMTNSLLLQNYSSHQVVL